ncbi:hypothetical protein V1281_001907 [Nitrobacteraceae bacterium AZCC 2161]
MNAAVRALIVEAVTAPPMLVLELRAEQRAYLWWNYQIEIDEAVEPLQTFAEQSGLIDQHGQDHIQEIIAAPFARLRARAAAEEDSRALLWAERQAPTIRAEPPSQRGYSTPKSTVDAFWYVLQQDDADLLGKWLDDHPRDSAFLHDIWKKKC